METCGTCKYRGDPIDDWDGREDGRTDYFLCARIKHINKSGSFAYEPGQHAGVKDGSGYHAALCVESDFGCTLWELSSRLRSPDDGVK